MKTYIVGLHKGVVVFVHDYETKEEMDSVFDKLSKELDNPHKVVWMNWYGKWVDNIQKWDY